MNEKAIPRMVPITKLTRETGLSYKLLRKLCEQSEIPHVRSGNRILINYDRLIDYLNCAGGGDGE